MSDECRVIQVTNVAPAATKEQMQTLFGFIGKLEECIIYPEMETLNVSRICYVKFYDSESVGVALHLSQTAFIDRAIVVTPVPDGKIPDEKTALTLADSNSGSYPGAPTVDDETRRTIYVGNLDPSVTPDILMQVFGSQAGEVKYVRMAGEDTFTTRAAFIEFTEQLSVMRALSMVGQALAGRPLRIVLANTAIIKPVLGGVTAATPREIEEAMKKVNEAQPLIDAVLDPNRSRSRSKSRRHGSRSHRSRSRRRSGSRSRRSRSRSRRRSRSRSHRSRRRSTSRPRRKSRSPPRRHRTKSRSRDRKSRSKSRDRKRRRSKSKSPRPSTKSRRSPSSSKASKSNSKAPSEDPPVVQKKSSDEPSSKKESRNRSRSPKRRSRSKSPIRRGERDRRRDGSKERKSSRERDRAGREPRDRDRDREKERDRDKDRREKDKDRGDRDRTRESDRERDRDRGRDKDRDSRKDRRHDDKERDENGGGKKSSEDVERSSPVGATKRRREEDCDEEPVNSKISRNDEENTAEACESDGHHSEG